MLCRNTDHCIQEAQNMDQNYSPPQKPLLREPWLWQSELCHPPAEASTPGHDCHQYSLALVQVQSTPWSPELPNAGRHRSPNSAFSVISALWQLLQDFQPPPIPSGACFNVGVPLYTSFLFILNRVSWPKAPERTALPKRGSCNVRTPMMISKVLSAPEKQPTPQLAISR